MAEEKKKNPPRDPELAPAKILLRAVLAANEAGVDRAQISSALRFALAAQGYKAPVWKAAAQSLTDAVTELKPAPPVATPDVAEQNAKVQSPA